MTEIDVPDWVALLAEDRYSEAYYKGMTRTESMKAAITAASVSERARALLAASYRESGDKAQALDVERRIPYVHHAIALRAIEQALTQQRGEIVAWIGPRGDVIDNARFQARVNGLPDFGDLSEYRPLYTTPQPSAEAVAALESRAARLEEALRRIVDSIDESGDPQWKGSPVEQQARAALLGGSG